MDIVEVIYHANDGTNTVKKQYVMTYGGNSKVLTRAFTRRGYTLLGYSTTVDGNTVEFREGNTLDGSVR